jgi:hypothetical protein
MAEQTPPPQRRTEDEHPPELDSDILRQAGSNDADDTNDASGERALAHVQAGAAVYGADGVEVAIVESVGPDHVVLLAGFPSRPVDLPASAIAWVSPDGQRLDLRIPAEEIERLTGENEPGYVHLQAEQPDTFSGAREGAGRPSDLD